MAKYLILMLSDSAESDDPGQQTRVFPSFVMPHWLSLIKFLSSFETGLLWFRENNGEQSLNRMHFPFSWFGVLQDSFSTANKFSQLRLTSKSMIKTNLQKLHQRRIKSRDND